MPSFSFITHEATDLLIKPQEKVSDLIYMLTDQTLGGSDYC